MTMPGGKDLKGSGEGQFCNFFHTFGIKKEQKEDYIKVGESRVGRDWIIVNKITYFLEGDHTFQGYFLRHFKGVLI